MHFPSSRLKCGYTMSDPTRRKITCFTYGFLNNKIPYGNEAFLNIFGEDWSKLGYCILESKSCFDEATSFEEEALYAHNYVREMHKVDSLRWDASLSRQSLEYAKEISKVNTLEHSVNAIKGFYGENIFKGFSGFKNLKQISEAVYYWYLEINGYDYTVNNPNFDVFGHFTELVWRSNVIMGCGYATNEIYGGLMTLIVCQYQPGGNLQGSFLLNVLPPKDGAVVPSSPVVLQVSVGCIDAIDTCSSWTAVCQVDVFKELMVRYCRKTCQLCSYKET